MAKRKTVKRKLPEATLKEAEDETQFVSPSDAIFVEMEEGEERFAFQWGKSTIWYRRLGSEGLRLVREATVKGGSDSDNEAFQRLVLERCILGWQNVQSAKPPYKELPFSIETALKMPDMVKLRFVSLINAAEYGKISSLDELPEAVKKAIAEAGEIKNSSSTAS